MFDLLKNNPRYLVGAIIVHLVFLILFGVGFHFKSENRATTDTPQTIKVNTIDERLVKKELQKLKQADEQEKRRKQELVEKRKAEEKKLKQIKEQRLAEQKKEQQRLALLKEKQAEEEKRLKQLEEQRRKKEAEEQKRRQQEQLARENELKEKMKAEAERMQKEQELAALRQAELKKKQTLIDKHMNMIEAEIYRNWTRPPGDLKGKVCELRVLLNPFGDVMDIVVSKSSGDRDYDKSVIAAVKKAAPLPVPKPETGLSDIFRNLTLPMRADQKT
jgi:colicin import membrane protein